MKAPRLPEVTARVVAWHNRHPLARRIDPTQVHSIGEVRLPFASQQPWGAAPVDAAPAAPAAAAPPDAGGHAPTLAEALAQRNARHQPPPAADASGTDLPAPPAGAATDGDIDLALDAATSAGSSASGDDSDGEAALVVPLLDGDDNAPDAAGPDALANPADAVQPDAAATATRTADADADATATATATATSTATATADDTAATAPPTATPAAPDPREAAPAPPEVYPPPHGNVPASALARAVERRAAARGAATAGPADAPADAPRPGRWHRLVAALRRAVTGRQHGMPPLRAAFSQDFAWPLRPGEVARWAQRHGQPWPVAPGDWPHRQIDADRARLATLRQKGLAHDIPLHVLTAAIGVGDRRIRVLLGADGSVLGPRAYSRARVGSAAAVLALGLVGAGWTLRPLHGGGADDGTAALAALAASAAAAAASAAPAASAADGTASATLLAEAASTPDIAASGAAAALADTHADTHAGAQADPAASAPASAHTETAAAPADETASQPQASIRPQLSDEARYAARVTSAKLRGEAPPPPPPEAIQGPVYAVVSPPSRQRDAAAGSLVLMKSAAGRLSAPVPTHGELLESQGQWRAAWWPFASLVDAERARVLLAGKGLKAEVVEF